MGLRRIAAGDQRRRRVLIEESLSVVSAEADSDQQRQPASKLGLVNGNSYSDAACLQRQSPSVILLASSPFTLTVTALSSLVLLVGLLAAYGHWRLWPQDLLPAPMSVLDLERPGNLAAWLCSLLLSSRRVSGRSNLPPPPAQDGRLSRPVSRLGLDSAGPVRDGGGASDGDSSGFGASGRGVGFAESGPGACSDMAAGCGR